MKTIINMIRVYEYHELSEKAKERVKEWYLDDIWRLDNFSEIIKEDLINLFPNSDLKVYYSLSSCQGDGLNVYGTINFNDFLKVDINTNSNVFGNYTEKEIKTLEFYFDYFNQYTFECNKTYCYSCKFIDKKYLDYTVKNYCEELEQNNIAKINIDLITRFFSDLLDWFEEYDREMEKAGYKYFYEVEEDELEEVCASNNYMFLESGEFYT